MLEYCMHHIFRPRLFSMYRCGCHQDFINAIYYQHKMNSSKCISSYEYKTYCILCIQALYWDDHYFSVDIITATHLGYDKCPCQPTTSLAHTLSVSQLIFRQQGRRYGVPLNIQKMFPYKIMKFVDVKRTKIENLAIQTSLCNNPW